MTSILGQTEYHIQCTFLKNNVQTVLSSKNTMYGSFDFFLKRHDFESKTMYGNFDFFLQRHDFDSLAECLLTERSAYQ